MNFYILFSFTILTIDNICSASANEEAEVVVAPPTEPEGVVALNVNRKNEDEGRKKSTNKIKRKPKVKGKKKKVPKRDLFKEAAKDARNGKIKEWSCGTSPVNVTKASKGAQGAFIELWANGVVPYIYDSTFLSIDRQAFEKAIDYVESKTCVKFKTRTSESDYMLVRRDGSCGGNCFNGGYTDGLGVGAPRSLVISCTCLDPSSQSTIGFLAHEIYHALGVVHTQTRPDRDSYITVNFNSISSNGASQYARCDQCKNLGTSYDCMSIMHYRDTFFSTGGLTMTAKNPNSCDLRNPNKILTSSDVDLIRTMYQCSGVNPPNTGSESCPATFGYWNCKGTYVGKTSNAYDCARLCKQSSTCKAWDISPSGYCYQTSEADCINPKSSFIAGTNCGNPCKTVENQVIGTGRDISNAKLNPTNCALMCSVTPECKSWTAKQFSGSWSCYLSAYGGEALSQSQGWFSGYNCNNANCNIMFGRYLCGGSGNYVTDAEYKSSIQACADWCKEFFNCAGWTRSPNSGYCWLMKSTSCQGSYSGWVAGERCF